MDMNKIRGGYLGVCLGDALGLPFEMNKIPVSAYNGKLEYPIKVRQRYKPTEYLPVGSISDDSSMTTALLYSILSNRGWNEVKVVEQYINWANQTNYFMGRNTRTLFSGTSSYNHFLTKKSKYDNSSVQSNGSLMRAFPLILLGDKALTSGLADTALTNPNPVNLDATLVYLSMLIMAYHGHPPKESLNHLLTTAQTQVIKEALLDAIHNRHRHVAGADKGWVAHPIYFTAKAWLLTQEVFSFEEIIGFVISAGGDTDTNAAISGAIVGLVFGETQLRSNPLTNSNIQILLNSPNTWYNLYKPSTGLIMLQ